MDIKFEKKFKNGNKIIAVTREVTTYFKVVHDGEEGNEIKEMNTIDELKTKTWSGLSDEFWNKVDRL